MKGWILGLAFVTLVGCSSPQRATYQMTWRLEPDRTCPTMRHVILQFTQFPAYQYGICSDDVARYLESYGSRPLTVDFAIYAPEAQLGGGEPIRIGSLSAWKEEFSHMGSYEEQPSAAPPAHPWTVVRTRSEADSA